MSYNEQLRCNHLTTNHEGALAWRMTPEWELYTTVVTTMGVEDKFYEGGEERVRRIADLVRKVKPEFVAQLAVYTREEMHLRSVPLLLLVELDCCHQGDTLVSKAVGRTIQRADEITELLMCYLWRSGKPDLSGLSSQLRKGLAEAFNKFDEYQFAKYNRKNRMVTLRDALALVHPKPKDDRQADIFRKIKSDTLETPVTWETELSAVGQRHFDSEEEKEEAKREVWRKLVQSHRLGYMATLRNLRNMLGLGMDEETMQMVCNYIANPEAVRKSKQLPFRFLSAFLELNNREKEAKSRLLLQRLQAKMFRIGCRIEAVRDKVEKMRQGDFYKMVRVVKRFHVKNANSIANLANVPMELASRLHKMHNSYRTRKWKHVDHPSMKDMEFLQRQEETLKKLQQQEEMLAKECEKMVPLVEEEEKQIQEDYENLQWNLDSIIGDNVLQSLESAVCHAAENIPGFDENTRVLLASDTSGSMLQPVSKNSSVMRYHIGLLLSMMMQHRCKNAVAGIFGDEWLDIEMPSDSILQNTLDLIWLEGQVGYSTNGYKVIEWLIQEHREMDKVMLFTDCQLWNSDVWANDARLAEYWDRYKREVAPHARLYIFDLAGYGQSPISMVRDDVFCIAGWSDKVFDILAAVERGKSAIDEIRRIVV